MGLAASQARFLGLTARKSNIEFQAQQINQARTALSNEVNGLYNEYNGLQVPVPPEVSNYSKTTYTVDSTYEEYQIINFTKRTDSKYEGAYNVTLQYEEKIPTGYPHSDSNTAITAQSDGSGAYSYLRFFVDGIEYEYDGTEKSTIKKINPEDYEKYPSLKTLVDEGKLDKDQVYYGYTNQLNGTTYYTSANVIDEWMQGIEPIENQTSRTGYYTFYYEGTKNVPKTVEAIANINQTADGRLSAIQFLECEDAPDLVNSTHSITTGQVSDQEKYNDAMNQYYYEKQLYEKETERINQKTKSLQAEDRSLELKLNQLDTEQRAISTEMDTVKEVLKSTIESVFKTFDG